MNEKRSIDWSDPKVRIALEPLLFQEVRNRIEEALRKSAFGLPAGLVHWHDRGSGLDVVVAGRWVRVDIGLVDNTTRRKCPIAWSEPCEKQVSCDPEVCKDCYGRLDGKPPSKFQPLKIQRTPEEGAFE